MSNNKEVSKTRDTVQAIAIKDLLIEKGIINSQEFKEKFNSIVDNMDSTEEFKEQLKRR